MNAPQVSGRDRSWLEDLFRRHHRQIRAYALRRVGPDDADDIVSEVFGTVWRSRSHVPQDALPWLYRTAANHVLHAHRGSARRSRLAPKLVTWVDEPMSLDLADAVGESLDAARRVRRMLTELPPDDAEILRLSSWEQLSPTEIAAVLGCSPTAARSRLQRARRRAEKVLHRLDTVDEDATEPQPTPVLTLLEETP